MINLNLAEFGKDFEQMKRNAHTDGELFTILQQYLHRHHSDLPNFPTTHHVVRNHVRGNQIMYRYKDLQYGKAKNYPMNERDEIYVEPEECVGTTWLYQSKHPDGQPYIDRLLRCILGQPETIPPILATQIGDYYMCNDGNHRIYTAYLMRRKVQVLVMGRHEEISHDL